MKSVVFISILTAFIAAVVVAVVVVVAIFNIVTISTITIMIFITLLGSRSGHFVSPVRFAHSAGTRWYSRALNACRQEEREAFLVSLGKLLVSHLWHASRALQIRPQYLNSGNRWPFGLTQSSTTTHFAFQLLDKPWSQVVVSSFPPRHVLYLIVARRVQRSRCSSISLKHAFIGGPDTTR